MGRIQASLSSCLFEEPSSKPPLDGHRYEVQGRDLHFLAKFGDVSLNARTWLTHIHRDTGSRAPRDYRGLALTYEMQAIQQGHEKPMKSSSYIIPKNRLARALMFSGFYSPRTGQWVILSGD